MILILAGGKSTDPSVHAIASHLIGTRVPPPLDPSNGKNGNENLLRVANKSCIVAAVRPVKSCDHVIARIRGFKKTNDMFYMKVPHTHTQSISHCPITGST
eukprot:scpid85268/ scgid31899/ 